MVVELLLSIVCVVWSGGVSAIRFVVTVYTTHGVFPRCVFLENSPSCYSMFSGQDFLGVP